MHLILRKQRSLDFRYDFPSFQPRNDSAHLESSTDRAHCLLLFA